MKYRRNDNWTEQLTDKNLYEYDFFLIFKSQRSPNLILKIKTLENKNFRIFYVNGQNIYVFFYFNISEELEFVSFVQKSSHSACHPNIENNNVKNIPSYLYKILLLLLNVRTITTTAHTELYGNVYSLLLLPSYYFLLLFYRARLCNTCL